jgi:large subunit ribosomal protein L15
MSSRNQRLAKRRGFNNPFKTQFEIVNLSRLGKFESGATVDPASLKAVGLIRGNTGHVKILGEGELSLPLHFEGVSLSASAREKILAAGGTVPAAGDTKEESDATGRA